MAVIVALIGLILGIGGLTLLFLSKKEQMRVILPVETTSSLSDKITTAFKERFSFSVWLQRRVGRVRILVLKVEQKLEKVLQSLRQKAVADKKLDDTYWQELKSTRTQGYDGPVEEEVKKAE